MLFSGVEGGGAGWTSIDSARPFLRLVHHRVFRSRLVFGSYLCSPSPVPRTIFFFDRSHYRTSSLVDQVHEKALSRILHGVLQGDVSSRYIFFSFRLWRYSKFSSQFICDVYSVILVKQSIWNRTANCERGDKSPHRAIHRVHADRMDGR